jgi:phosphatidylglycerol lysyltransferase
MFPASRMPTLSSLAQVVTLAARRALVPSSQRDSDGSVFEVWQEWPARVEPERALSTAAWSFLSSPDHRAFEPFQEGAFSLLGWRDPVGPREARDAAVSHFRRYAQCRGKQVVIVGASTELTGAAEEVGFASARIGTEHFVDLARGPLDGAAGEAHRRAIDTARQAGATARELHPADVDWDRHEVRRVVRAGEGPHRARMRALVRRVDPYERGARRRYFGVETLTASGPRLQGFIVGVSAGSRGWHLQDVAFARDAPAGVAAMVFAVAFDALRQSGCALVDLGIASWEAPDRSTTHPVLGACLRRFERSGESLAQYFGRFHATRAEAVYALYWPRVITPLLAWDVARFLFSRRDSTERAGP